mmetsp:Transcript_679/g.2479  ORF Transcript_679/g.2479 Transcript_679/m.2479 type:complete len:159 (-) Transcript_679:836-1312(-)
MNGLSQCDALGEIDCLPDSNPPFGGCWTNGKCDDITSTACESACVETYKGAQCACPEGYYLAQTSAGTTECEELQADDSSDGAAVVVVVLLILLACLVVGGGVGFYFYNKRLRRSMDSEIRGIMAEYMPLEGVADKNGQGSSFTNDSVRPLPISSNLE